MRRRCSQLRRLVISLVVAFPSILPGIAFGYVSIALPALGLSVKDASWFSSVTLFGSPLGLLLSGLIIDKYGRKLCLLWSIVPNIVGWSLLWMPANYAKLCAVAGRFFIGLTGGASTYISSVYLAEFVMRNNVNFRSSFATWSMTAFAVGVCSVYGLGSFYEYDTLAGIAVILSCVFLALVVIVVPESPIWLYQQGRVGDAELVLHKLSMDKLITTSRAYLLSLPDDDDETRLWRGNENGGNDGASRWKTLVKTFVRRDVYKPLFVTTTLLSFAILSGGTTLTNYMVANIAEEADTEDETRRLLITSGIVQAAICLSLTFILPCTGNRTLTIVSGAGMSLGTLTVGVTSMLRAYNKSADTLHTFAIWWSIATFSLGFRTVPNALLGEVFPTEIQGVACVPIMATVLVNYAFIRFHSYAFTYYRGVVYILYSLMGAVGTYFVRIYMPETVGRTLEHVRSEFLA